MVFWAWNYWKFSNDDEKVAEKKRNFWETIFDYAPQERSVEVYFWHSDKHRSLLQVDTTIFVVHSQACPEYPKQEVCISLQCLQKDVGYEVDFLPADKHQRFFQIDTIILGVCGQACPNYPKCQVCYFFAIF